jgi:branched-chain amino acid aminotransferase
LLWRFPLNSKEYPRTGQQENFPTGNPLKTPETGKISRATGSGRLLAATPPLAIYRAAGYASRRPLESDPMPIQHPSAGSQDYVGDPRNDDVFISVDGDLVRRPEAKVSVFDSGFVLGDGVWEGLRLHAGRIAFLDRHFDRLWDGAKMLRIDIGLTREALKTRLFDLIDANAMRDGVHIRLMVTRGVKRSPYQDPRLTIGAATIVIIPEWKLPRPEMLARGLNLFTVHIRRTGPAEQDQKLNSHSKLNCILACIQAMEAGADEALMLDDRGFVATCNSTHFFIVRKGELWTSGGGYCLAGITRDAVLRAARRAGLTAYEKDFSLFDVYGADEAFCTGTFAGLTPVARIDGRPVGEYEREPADASGPMTKRLRALYKALEAEEARGR